MQIWFCQTCGAQVTEAELGPMPGANARTLVYCKDCQKKENRVEKMAAAAEKPIRNSPRHGTAPAVRKSPRQGTAPLPRRGSGSARKGDSQATLNPAAPNPTQKRDSGSAKRDAEPAKRDSGPARRDSGGTPRRGSGSALRRDSGTTRAPSMPNTSRETTAEENGYEAQITPPASKKRNRTGIIVAGVVGWCLLLAGVCIFVFGMPERHKTAPLAITDSPAPDPKAAGIPPEKEPDPEKSAEEARSLETRAKQAFSILEEKLKDPQPGNAAQLAELDAFLKEFGDSILGARARTIREKLIAPPEPKQQANEKADPAQDQQNKILAAMRADPVNKHVIRADELMQQKDLNGALAEYDRALILDPRNGTICRARAWVRVLLMRYDDALGDATKAAELMPEDVNARALEAVIAYAVGKKELYEKLRPAVLALAPAESRPAFKAWLAAEAEKGRIVYRGSPLEKKDPETAEEWMYRGLFRLFMGHDKDGEADLRQAIKIAPEETGLLQAYMGLINLFDARNEFKARMDVLEQWVKAQPKSTFALGNYSWELLNSKDEALRDAKRALPLAEKAAELSKHEDAAVEDTLALAYFENGQVGRAYEIQKHAIAILSIDMSPEDRQVYVQHLAQYELVKPADP